MVSRALDGIFRSLRIYHGDKDRNAAMDRLYSRFLSPGDLAFDIGSHVGDRVSSFRRLGARVVAVEPQPLALRALRLIHGRDTQVNLINAACGARPGSLRLRVNSANPTVSTASRDFTNAARDAPGWEGQAWDTEIEVACVTLDQLIDSWGPPRFTKIDVEGLEADVLQGLTHQLPVLSFEFTTIQRDVAYQCLRRLMVLAQYRFNVALGESQKLAFDQPISHIDMQRYIADLPHAANSGDIYALLCDA
ncbi:MAG: FkbM family methyltransferase [Hyphomicrobiaceae bacterium]